MIVPRPLFALLAGVILLGACRKAEITSYRIPKEKDPEPAAAKAPDAGNAMANTPVATASGPSLVWQAPASWTAKPATPSRKATYGISDGAEVSVTAFDSDVGGELANFNRWRGQVGLPPASAAEFEKAVERHDHDNIKMAIVDIAGGGRRILGAWAPFNGGTWFFKLGPAPDAVAAKEKENFLAFVESVRLPARNP